MVLLVLGLRASLTDSTISRMDRIIELSTISTQTLLGKRDMFGQAYISIK